MSTGTIAIISIPTDLTFAPLDRHASNEVVAEYLGLSIRALRQLAGGYHRSGRKIGSVEVTPNQRRYKYEHVMEYVQKYTHDGQ